MDWSPEKISDMKQMIHSFMSQDDIRSKIEDAVNGFTKDKVQNDINDEELLGMLRSQGVIKSITQQLESETNMNLNSNPLPSIGAFINEQTTVGKEQQNNSSFQIKPGEKPMDRSKCYLYMQIIGGRAFLDNVLPESVPEVSISLYSLHIFFRGQRLKSKQFLCSVEPDIGEGFLLELFESNSKMASASSLLNICDPIHLVLIKTDSSGDTFLISSHFLEWRTVLYSQSTKCRLNVQLMGIRSENKVPIGLLEIQFDIYPNLPQPLNKDVVETQINTDKARCAEQERLFLVYAKQWWKEYLNIRPSHGERLIKIFSQDENGNSRPVCSYIKPLKAGRLLDTPREAARFVSLVRYEKASAIGGGVRAEQWSSMHAFLCCNKGDVEDHSVLLCSLLLGFGLNAFVCVGTRNKGTAHVWVATIDSDETVIFWESLTGHRYTHQPINPDDPPAKKNVTVAHQYKTISCVFNHESFYANNQPNEDIIFCLFSLNDESKWKAMSPETLKAILTYKMIPLWPQIPPICKSLLDANDSSNELETELRSLIYHHRNDQGLNTIWDDELSYYMNPALAAYETEKITGLSVGNEEFQQAIKAAVPDGHTFKGYPILFTHRNARRALNHCLKEQIAKGIFDCRGDHVRHAVRVRIFVYPEQACAVWIMFACKYKCVV